MKKRITWKDLNLIEKIIVILYYAVGFVGMFAVPIIMYLQAPVVW